MADKSLCAATLQVNIASTTVLAENSSNENRAFKLVTRAGQEYRHEYEVTAPLNAPIVDEVIEKLGSTDSPLHDLQHLVASLSSLRDAYQAVTGLTAEMEDKVRVAEAIRSRAQAVADQSIAAHRHRREPPKHQQAARPGRARH